MKTLTPEQLAASAERKAKFKALQERLKAMTEAERAALAARVGVVTIEGHAMSVKNSCLIWMQNPGASVVGGFAQWRKTGRAVRKGESGLMIWFPCTYKRKDKTTGEPIDGEEIGGFKTGFVFDIGQTEPIAAPVGV